MKSENNHVESPPRVNKSIIIAATLAMLGSGALAAVWFAPNLLNDLGLTFSSDEPEIENYALKRRAEADRQVLRDIYRGRSSNQRINPQAIDQAVSANQANKANKSGLVLPDQEKANQDEAPLQLSELEPQQDQSDDASDTQEYAQVFAAGGQSAAGNAASNQPASANKSTNSRSFASAGGGFFGARGSSAQNSTTDTQQQGSSQTPSTVSDEAISNSGSAEEPTIEQPAVEVAEESSVNALPAFAVVAAGSSVGQDPQEAEQANASVADSTNGSEQTTNQDTAANQNPADTNEASENEQTDVAAGSDEETETVAQNSSNNTDANQNPADPNGASENDQTEIANESDEQAETVTQNSTESSDPDANARSDQSDNQLANNSDLNNAGPESSNTDGASEESYQFDPDVVVSEVESLPGTVEFDGLVKNNGIIVIPDDSLLTLSGALSGSGTFDGDVMLQGNTVNPGNSPGILTFAEDLVWEDTVFELEIQGTQTRGVDYDAIDVMGDFTLMDVLYIDVILLDGILLSDLYDAELEIFQVYGDFYNSTGELLDDPFDLQLSIDSAWTLEWREEQDNWSLFAYVETPITDVPEPKTILMIILGLTALFYLRRYGPGKKRAS